MLTDGDDMKNDDEGGFRASGGVKWESIDSAFEVIIALASGAVTIDLIIEVLINGYMHGERSTLTGRGQRYNI